METRGSAAAYALIGFVMVIAFVVIRVITSIRGPGSMVISKIGGIYGALVPQLHEVSGLPRLLADDAWTRIPGVGVFGSASAEGSESTGYFRAGAHVLLRDAFLLHSRSGGVNGLGKVWLEGVFIHL